MVQNYHVTAYRGLVTLSTLGANTQPLQITKLWKQHPGSCVCGWQKGGGERVRWRRNLRSTLTVLEPSLELLQDWRMWSRHREWLEQEDSNSLMWGEKKSVGEKSETNGWTVWPAPMSPKAKHLWTFSFELSHPVTLRNKPTEMTWFLRYLVKPFYHITYIVQWI